METLTRSIRRDVTEFSADASPHEIASRFAGADGLIVSDDAEFRAGRVPTPRGGGRTLITADPVVSGRVERVRFGEDPFAGCRAAYREFGVADAGTGGFAGGLAGVIGYEVGSAFERVGRPGRDEFAIPDLIWGLYDWGLTVEAGGRATLAVTVLADGAEGRAEERLDWCLGRLSEGSSSCPLGLTPRAGDRAGISKSDLKASHPVVGLSGWSSDFSRPKYERAVADLVAAIDAGEVFQANLAQRLTRPFGGDPLALAATLAEVDPAPHAGFAAFDDWAVVSASPERFLRVEGRDVLTQPIKGTRPAGSPDDLAHSEKDRAENVMIVDLLRNDLSRVCEPASVRVGGLCRLQEFGHVRHLVSDVRGRLREGADVWDLLAATLPGGSISGAPKVRAMELIAAAEPVVRGPYCGQLFRYGFDGVFESSILIRTAVVRGGLASVSVGGGVTTASDPAAEYEETLAKAAGLAAAFARLDG